MSRLGFPGKRMPSPTFSKVILGGGHDLSDNIERIGGGQVEYVRVQVEAHKKLVGE